MNFAPSIIEPQEQNGPNWWFTFCKEKLLVRAAYETADIPYMTNLAELNLKPIRRQFLGTLEGRPCYSAELADDANAPEGMAFYGLRSLFGSMNEDMFKIAGLALHITNWDQTHQYCGRCGASTENKHDERAKICLECGLVNYPRVSPAVIVAVTKGKQILLARGTRFPKKKMFYSVLAGYVEPGETIEECVRREIREEVSIEVKNIRYFGSQPWPFSSSLMIAFTADYAGGEIKPDASEILDAGWFTADNLPDLPGWGSIARQLVDGFVENIHKGK